jgi:Flp pilus assembly pilin Flp
MWLAWENGMRKRRSRGAVVVEYAFLLAAVAIPATAGMVLGGKAMFENYKEGRNAILQATP